jgi:hypothetical protein
MVLELACYINLDGGIRNAGCKIEQAKLKWGIGILLHFDKTNLHN